MCARESFVYFKIKISKVYDTLSRPEFKLLMSSCSRKANLNYKLRNEIQKKNTNFSGEFNEIILDLVCQQNSRNPYVKLCLSRFASLRGSPNSLAFLFVFLIIRHFNIKLVAVLNIRYYKSNHDPVMRTYIPNYFNPISSDMVRQKIVVFLSKLNDRCYKAVLFTD